MMYEILDLESFNLVGVYPSEEAALLAILETIHQSGAVAAESLSLSLPDPTGRSDGWLIAQGPELVGLARARGNPAHLPAHVRTAE